MISMNAVSLLFILNLILPRLTKKTKWCINLTGQINIRSVMPKIGMEPVRRAEAINAALECICEVGIDHLTLEMVADRAGFSKGIVAYYFKTKKQLILESLKAFLASYQRKSIASITPGMQPLEMVAVIVETALPPQDVGSPDRINVSTLDGAGKICLPEPKMTQLFVQYISKAMTDKDVMEVMRAAYTSDAQSIAGLFNYINNSRAEFHVDENEAAYTLLALMYGLSFFRVAQFMPEGETDNRQVAFNFIGRMFGSSTKNKEEKS
jgi:TetR/AcrR family transcriptional regulator, transcriptional repressor of bet genes